VPFEIGLVLGLLVLIIILFSTEKVPVDLATVLALTVLVLTRVITFAEAVEGFYSPVMLLLVGIFVVSAALVRTGTTEAIGRAVQGVMGSRPRGVLLGICSAVAAVSAWMNNTTVTAIFVPPALGIARRLRQPASRFLMPVAYASMLGGTCTLIGTSTNVAVSGMLPKYGQAPLSMFELAPVGVVVTLVGLLYIVYATRLLPIRTSQSLAEDYHLREFLSEVVIVPGSPLAGRPLVESGLGTTLDLTVLAIHREGHPAIVSPKADEILQERDLLIVQGRAQQIAGVKEARGIEMRADLHPSAADLTSEQVNLAEVIPAPNSDLIGRTLKEVNFRGRFGVTAVGLYRAGESLAEKVGTIQLRFGDVLLVQGRREAIETLGHSAELELLEDVTHYVFDKKKGFLSAAIFAAAIVAGTAGFADISHAVVAAALLVVVTRCVPWQDVYKLIYWRLLVLIAGMMAFGTAMANSRADHFLADLVIGATGGMGPTAVLAGFFLVTVLLTQPMSNAAAAQVVLPVALSAAGTLGVNPRTFAVTVCIAASCSFLTPFEPSCLLVYGPGRYKVRDFIVFGTPLTLAVMVITILMAPWIWPF
jgi:di/tricarboxylate transporter